VDLQTNLARHLDWYCGWNLATALVGLLVASSVRNLVANLVAGRNLHGLARPHRLFFLLFVAYGRLLLSVAHLSGSRHRILVAIPVRNPEAARPARLLWCLCGLLLLQGGDEKSRLKKLRRSLATLPLLLLSGGSTTSRASLALASEAGRAFLSEGLHVGGVTHLMRLPSCADLDRFTHNTRLTLLFKPCGGLVMTLLRILGATNLPKRLLTHIVILQLLLCVVNLKATSSFLLLPPLLHFLLLVPEGAGGRNKQTKEQWEGTKTHGW